MPELKLIAFDDADLAVISAHVQDAILRVCDIDWRPRDRRTVLALNRFAWEKAEATRPPSVVRRPQVAMGFSPLSPQAAAKAAECGARCHTAITIKHVTAVRSQGIRRDVPDGILSLLAVTFEPGEAPGGTVRLVFAGGGEVRLDVECLEVQLCDLGGSWAARAKPQHEEVQA